MRLNMILALATAMTFACKSKTDEGDACVHTDELECEVPVDDTDEDADEDVDDTDESDDTDENE